MKREPPTKKKKKKSVYISYKKKNEEYKKFQVRTQNLFLIIVRCLTIHIVPDYYYERAWYSTIASKDVRKTAVNLPYCVMKFDRSNKLDFRFKVQVNSLHLKSSVASKWASKHLWGTIYFASDGTCSIFSRSV